MNISKSTFFDVGNDLKIPMEKMEAFWAALEAKSGALPSPFTKFIYYFGVLIVIIAMGLFMTIGQDIFGQAGLFLIALSYGCLFLWLGQRLWKKKDLKVPGGLLATAAVCMVPLAVYSLLNYLNKGKALSENMC